MSVKECLKKKNNTYLGVVVLICMFRVGWMIINVYRYVCLYVYMYAFESSLRSNSYV